MFAYAKPEQKKTSKDTVQKKETKNAASSPNMTGIPSDMKLQLENISGFSFDDVRIHYNSNKPAQLQALAYTRGNQVHIAPGQEKSLRHELGHVVQQRQGRVKPTIQLEGMEINDDPALEREADEFGRKMSEYNPEAAGEYVQFLRTTSYSSVAQGYFGEVVQRHCYWETKAANWDVASPKPTANPPAKAKYWKRTNGDQNHRLYNTTDAAKAAAAAVVGMAQGFALQGLNATTHAGTITSVADLVIATKIQDLNVAQVTAINQVFPGKKGKKQARQTANNLFSAPQYKVKNVAGDDWDYNYQEAPGVPEAVKGVRGAEQGGNDEATGEYYYYGALADSIPIHTPVIAKHTADQAAVLSKHNDKGNQIGGNMQSVNHWHAGITSVQKDVGDWSHAFNQPLYTRAGTIEHYFIKP